MKWQPNLWLSLFALTLSASSSAERGPTVNSETRLVYSMVDGAGLVVDVLDPTNAPNGLGLVVVYSGGWYCGDAVGAAFEKARLYEILRGRGYTVFLVRPGARPRFSGSEMVANLKRSIQWVKAHAEEYAVDPGSLGLFGASSGGHLALMAAVDVEAASHESESALNRFSSDVAAVAAFFPPTDMRDWNGDPEGYKLLADLFAPCGFSDLPQSEAESLVDAISPSKHVKVPPPPLLLVHGDADTLVPLSQSEKMAAAIQAVGGDVELIVKQDGGHSWPDLDQDIEKAADWFDGVLGAD